MCGVVYSTGIGLRGCYLLLEGLNPGVKSVSDQSLEVHDCFIQLIILVVKYDRIEQGERGEGEIGGYCNSCGGLLL